MLVSAYKQKSSIFEEFIPEARAQRPVTTSQASEVLQYRYGPDYREAEITAKPSNARFNRDGLRQVDDLKSVADSLKEKRNQSSIFNY